MNHLVPCPECSRHVRVSEEQCPFSALPLDLANAPPQQLPRGRLSRAATFAFGATLVSATALSACGENGAPVPLYGAPPLEGAGSPGSSNGGSGRSTQPAGGQSGVAGSNMGSGGGTVYGGPPAEDAGMGGAIDLPGAAGASGEAGAAPDDTGGKGGGPVAVYGGPP
jgi:hypothetical protein